MGLPLVAVVDEFDGDDQGDGECELGEPVFGSAVGVAAQLSEVGPSRIRGIEGCWRRLGSLCHEDASGFEVAWVGEAVGGASQDLEQCLSGGLGAVMVRSLGFMWETCR